MTFFFKTTTEYFLHLALFTCTFHWWILLTGEEICWICFNFTSLAQFFGVHTRANSRWLTDQSELALYVCYVLKNIKQNIAQRSFVHVWKLLLRCPFPFFLWYTRGMPILRAHDFAGLPSWAAPTKTVVTGRCVSVVAKIRRRRTVIRFCSGYPANRVSFDLLW